MSNGIDLTPIYRAAAKGLMLQGAASIVGGIVVALIGSAAFQLLGVVLIAVGAARVAYGFYRYRKYS